MAVFKCDPHSQWRHNVVAAYLNARPLSGTLTLNRPSQLPAPIPATRPGAAILTAGKVQIKIPLNAAEVAAVLQRFISAGERIPMTIRAVGEISDSRCATVFRLRATFAPKGIRKALAVLQEHGPEGVFVYIQGRLGSQGDEILDAGLIAQPKQPKPEMPDRG